MILTLYEHEAQPFDWSDHHLQQLDQLRAQLGVEVIRASVARGQRVLQAAQHVGVVRLSNLTVQILPKIYRTSAQSNDQTRAREATANLLHLLAYTGTITIREAEISSLLDREADWFEILTRLFASHLREEWRRSPPRRYHTVEAEQPVLKGSWQVAQQLRYPHQKHLFHVRYDEFTVDHALNRVFRFVVERLWRLTRSAENQRLLGDLRHWMDEVTLPAVVTPLDAGAHLIDRMTMRYVPLLNLARLFLSQHIVQLATGVQSTFAFVFDMNQLFERMIAAFLTRHRDSILPEQLQQVEFLVQARGAAEYLVRNANNRLLRLEPDILCRLGNSVPLLLDTKYKRLLETERLLGISQSDFYQMYAYAQRYQCPHVVLLFPQTADVAYPIRQTYTLEGTNDWAISVATIDIRQPITKASAQQVLANELQTILARENLHDTTTT